MEIENQILEIVERLEKRPTVLEEALKLLSKDMHTASSRPCSTCKVVTAVLGYPFGCYELIEKRQCKEGHTKRHPL